MTPNPCVQCNKLVKFETLFKAKILYQADAVATGHYAKILENNNEFFLAQASNADKDQSYFLYNIQKV